MHPWGTVSRPRPATREDMNALGGYVASYQPWFSDPAYLQDTAPAARETFERFAATYRDSWDESFTADLNPELRRFFAARLAED